MIKYLFKEMVKNHFGAIIRTIQFSDDIPSTIHSHEFYEIFLICKGHGIHVLNEKKHIIQEGSLVFLRPDEVHYYLKDKDSPILEWVNLNLEKSYIDELLTKFETNFNIPDELFTNHISLDIVQYNLYKDKFNFLQNELYTYPAVQQTMYSLFVEEMLILFLSNNYSRSHKEMPDWLSATLKKFEQYDLTVNSLNDLVDLSNKTQEHLTRSFKKHLNVTPTEYINSLKMKKASAMLLGSKKSILDIIYECGFNSPSYFNKLFKDKYKMSPRAFRDSYSTIF